jgi:2-oxoglutarate dehydrogenase E2 component (dihydrolipoamide succinyltransferase)
MAIVEVKVPQLSESVSEATMLQWKKKPGEAVAQDEILIEIETDKVVLEVPAPSAGVLAQVISNDGDIVVADQVIAKIDTEGTAGAAAVEAEVKPAPVAAPAPAAAPAAQAASATGANTAASPAAGKLMAEKGLGAGDVAGTGRDGRITKGDVLTAGAAPAPAAKAAPAPAAAPKAAKPSLPDVKAPASAET